MPTERARRGLALVVLGVLIALLAALALGATALYYSVTRQPAPWQPSCSASVNGESVRLDPEQARNAAIIAGVSVRRGLAPRAASIGIATALQESGLRNLDHGDRDSLGLFQQRPSQGWGTAAQVQDPWYAANAFYAAMEKVKGWQTADIGDVAQTVQKSGFPDAYDKHVPNARLLASALTGETPAAFTCSVQGAQAKDAAALGNVLSKSLPKDASVATSGTTLTVRAPSTQAAWSAAALAVADAATHGVRSVSVGGRSWTASWPLASAWSTTASSTDATTVQIVVG